ncbi:hypothetical protein B0H16DRAFT_1721648 [Mycena metata]|uniref:F-box domain-containing protein n=1 Tax=Mycena metata TaxID=1033252 RepID=A0AAD7J5E8_9AGAR|nr:hypothetical protein B0H16DRAFT_1721648 [Mycena metata]
MNAELAKLLLHNDPPTEQQAKEIQNLLDVGGKELSQLEDTISKVSLVLSELKAQQRRLAESLAPLECALAPIRRIPPEILGEVFRLCGVMQVDDRFSQTHMADPAAAPLILGHVCSLWRTVSQNTPQLWDRVCLRSNAITTHTFQFIRTLFIRSCSLPLNVHIFTPSNDNGRYVGLLWEFRDRLQHLRLLLNSDGPLPTITPDHNSLPMLKSLFIYVLEDDIGTNMKLTEALNLFQNAPLLRDLTLENDHMSLDLLNCPFPWSQLTSLRITMPIDAAAVRHILFQCVRLEQCSLYDIDCEAYVPPTPPRTLHSLLSFQLTPNPEGSQGYAREFVRSSHSPPYELCTFELTSTILPTHPNISTDLDIAYCDCVTDALFSAFTYVPRSSAPLALPKLETLKIQEITDNLDGSVVADMVDSLRSHAGDIRAPFPLITSVVLDLDGADSRTL